jgi:site-specific recombinase XerD
LLEICLNRFSAPLLPNTRYQDLEDIEPITVAAYIETLQRQAAPPTVKQHMAAIRMLFSWLTEKGVLAMNPAREVKTERFSRTEGKTPAFVEGEVPASAAAFSRAFGYHAIHIQRLPLFMHSPTRLLVTA